MTELRSSPVLPSYPKRVWDNLKQALDFTVHAGLTIRYIGIKDIYNRVGNLRYVSLR